MLYYENGKSHHSRAGDAGKENEMANHKRKRPKSTRSGCLFCKPHKRNGLRNSLHFRPRQDREARLRQREQMDEADEPEELP
jgi:hypothetical protein